MKSHDDKFVFNSQGERTNVFFSDFDSPLSTLMEVIS